MNNFDEFRVFLRALELDDYKRSIKWRRDDEIWSMVGGPKYFVSSVVEKSWVENSIKDDDINLAICLKNNNNYIGNVYLKDIDYINKTAESHILIGEKKLWGNGYGYEAEMLILKFAFNERNLNRIYAKILEDNVGSIKLHEKCGYKKEGVLRKAVYKKGEYKNLLIMSILENEFRNELSI
mgnify:CR=1 FL=1